MKKILQSLKTGKTEAVEVPIPNNKEGHLLIQSSVSLISSGTEKMLLEFGKAGLIDKARQQPEKVKMVFDKIKSDGLKPTLETILNKLDQPLPLGYCNVGKVAESYQGRSDFKIGERVISNGHHADIVSVPLNLCSKVPNNVSDEEAAFTVLGAISLQGVRLANPTLGETVTVIGLGLVGLLTVQLLKANGCKVIGVDFDKEKLKLASSFGAEVVDLSLNQDPVKMAIDYSKGRGVDAVIITAATTSNEPLHQAALMSRQRGRIILVGVTGLELSREDFYKKELTFQVSASYGPGRYDQNYEEKGLDYPVGFVRWTEQRNFEAVLSMMSDGQLDVKPLISHRFTLEEAEEAYGLVLSDEPSLGIILTYEGLQIDEKSKTIKLESSFEHVLPNINEQEALVSFIGSGNYATSILIPAFKKNKIVLNTITSNSGVSGVHAGRKFGFQESTTDTEKVFTDSTNNAVVITTQHDSHASYVLQGLKAGKNIFVEKPLCLTTEELEEIESTYLDIHKKNNDAPILMVGFNRRFSPHAVKIKKLLENIKTPKSFIMTVNAGQIPEDHWTQDPSIGGGRIIGESCHYVDLLRHLAGVSISSYSCIAMNSSTKDTVVINLIFSDGSIGAINYLANGNKSFPKERLEIFADNGILQLDNFRKLRGFEWPGFSKMNLWSQDKGQIACSKAFIEALQKKSSSPISFKEIIEVSKISIELSDNSVS